MLKNIKRILVFIPILNVTMFFFFYKLVAEKTFKPRVVRKEYLISTLTIIVYFSIRIVIKQFYNDPLFSKISLFLGIYVFMTSIAWFIFKAEEKLSMAKEH